MTQLETIKQMLATEQWVCGTEFMGAFIPEYRSRINEIRKQGYLIDHRKCQQHNHKSPNLQEWRLVSKGKIKDIIGHYGNLIGIETKTIIHAKDFKDMKFNWHIPQFSEYKAEKSLRDQSSLF